MVQNSGGKDALQKERQSSIFFKKKLEWREKRGRLSTRGRGFCRIGKEAKKKINHRHGGRGSKDKTELGVKTRKPPNDREGREPRARFIRPRRANRWAKTESIRTDTDKGSSGEGMGNRKKRGPRYS